VGPLRAKRYALLRELIVVVLLAVVSLALQGPWLELVFYFAFWPVGGDHGLVCLVWETAGDGVFHFAGTDSMWGMQLLRRVRSSLLSMHPLLYVFLSSRVKFAIL
jgi:hypothetical protein